MGDERVWPPELHVRADLLAEPASDGTVLDAHDLHACRALLREELAVKRLQVPRVHRDPADARRDLARLPVPVACRPDREAGGRVGGLRGGGVGEWASWRLAAGIANHRRAVAVKSLLKKRLQVIGVLWLADRDIRQAPEHRDVVDPLVRNSVSANDASAIYAEDDGQVGDRDIVHHLVYGPLEKRRIDRDDRPHAAAGETRRERDHVTLRYADVEEAVREARGKRRKPRSVAHRRSQRDDAGVFLRELAQRLAENLAPAGRRLCLLAVRRKREVDCLRRRRPWERANAVPCSRVFLRGAVAVPLLRDDVEKNGAVFLLRGRERRDERREIVAVNRPEVVEAELLEPDVAEHHRLEAVLHPVDEPVEERQPKRAADLLGNVLRAVVSDARREAAEPLRDAPRRLSYRHVVVVQDDDKPLRSRRTVVERLEARAVRERRVAYDGDDVLLAATPVARGGKTLGDRKRNARMSCNCGIGLGLGGVGEAGDPAHLAKSRESGVSAGEDLPRVCLVADVPNDAVGLGIEDFRKSHRDLDCAERRREMAAVLRNGL